MKRGFPYDCFNRSASRQNLTPAFPFRFDTNWAVLPQKLVRGLTEIFIISKEVHGLYNICSTHKGGDFLYEISLCNVCSRVKLLSV